MLVNLSAPRASKRNIPRGVRTREVRAMTLSTAARRLPGFAVVAAAHALVLAWLLALTRTHPGRAGAEESLTLVVLLPAARSQSSRPLLATPPGVAPDGGAQWRRPPGLNHRRPERRRRRLGRPRLIGRPRPPALRPALCRTRRALARQSGCLRRARCSPPRLLVSQASPGTTRALTGSRPSPAG